MYLRGLALYNAGDYEEVSTDPGAVALPSPYPSAPMPSPSGSQYSDWINLGTAALKTWGSVRVAETQAKAQVASAPYQYRPTYYTGSPIPTARAGYSPFPAGGGDMGGLLTLAALGIGAVAVYNFMK